MTRSYEKKILLVIVEGRTDSDALELCLSSIFSRDDLIVEITHGDVTSRAGVNPASIRRKVGKVVHAFLARNHFLTRSDIREVIQLTDTDGAFIPDEAVYQNSTFGKIRYSTSAITTPCRRSILERNKRKSSCLKELVKTRTVLGSIPYRIFFMSCNIEHVLHNKLNCGEREKVKFALEFALRFKDNPAGFKRFMESSDFAVLGGYEDSWNYIRQGTESLNRHSNLALAWHAHKAHPGS